MPATTRSLANLPRSPVCVDRWTDDLSSCGSSVPVEYTKRKVSAAPLVKSVQFAEQNEVFEITHLNDMTPDVVAAIWYDTAAYARIKEDYQITIYMMENEEPLVGEDNEPRGLEYRTQTGQWARYENKRDAYNAVLDEQDKQWAANKDDWTKISAAYIEISEKCTKAAYERGLADRQAIIDYIATKPAKSALKSSLKTKPASLTKSTRIKAAK